MTASLEDQLEALAAEPPEIHMILRADVDHILTHTGIDEPSGTWTGGACPRHGRQVGSDVDLADLGVMSRSGAGLTDACWYAPPGLAQMYRIAVRATMAPGAREHSLDWWQHRINVAWSYAWKANYTFLTEVVEAPARARGSDGLLVASFEHNSSEHGLARPHVHNLMVRRPEGRDSDSAAEPKPLTIDGCHVLPLAGWDQSSVWGLDRMEPAYGLFANLWPNTDSGEDSPRHQISEIQDLLMLAREIAALTGCTEDAAANAIMVGVRQLESQQERAANARPPTLPARRQRVASSARRRFRGGYHGV